MFGVLGTSPVWYWEVSTDAERKIGIIMKVYLPATPGWSEFTENPENPKFSTTAAPWEQQIHGNGGWVHHFSLLCGYHPASSLQWNLQHKHHSSSRKMDGSGPCSTAQRGEFCLDCFLPTGICAVISKGCSQHSCRWNAMKCNEMQWDAMKCNLLGLQERRAAFLGMEMCCLGG